MYNNHQGLVNFHNGAYAIQTLIIISTTYNYTVHIFDSREGNNIMYTVSNVQTSRTVNKSFC